MKNNQGTKKQSGGCCISILVIVGLVVLLTIMFGRKQGDKASKVIFDFSDHSAIGKEIDPQGLRLQSGELISITQTEGTVVIKAKTKPNLSNEMTINQNFYLAGDLIRNHGFNTCDKFQYWAVMDMTDGSEQKVVQYALTKDVINGVYNKSILDNQIRDRATDVWILPSMMK